MDTLNHAAEAERLLAFLTADYHGDADWAQVLATRALAHATLAGLLQPSFQITPRGEHHVSPPPTTIWCSTDRDEMDPIVVFQGDRVRAQRDLYEGQFLSDQDYA